MALNLLAELDELALKCLEAVGEGVRHIGVIHRRFGESRTVGFDNTSRDADHGGVRRHGLQNDRVGPDLDVIPDADSPLDFSAGPHHDMVS